jgi:hypothetical protein
MITVSDCTWFHANMPVKFFILWDNRPVVQYITALVVTVGFTLPLGLRLTRQSFPQFLLKSSVATYFADSLSFEIAIPSSRYASNRGQEGCVRNDFHSGEEVLTSVKLLRLKLN